MDSIPKGYKNTDIGVIPEDWRTVLLGKKATLKARIGWQGLTTAEYKESGEYYLITGTEFTNGFINWAECNYIEKKRYDQDRHIQVKAKDVLVTKDGTIGKVAYVKGLTKPATLNSGVFVIRPTKNSFKPEYFYHILSSSIFRRFLAELSAGSTINHLYQKDFVKFVFQVPEDSAEQDSISTALSNIDSLITSLEKLVEKKKMIRQGVMQELLTGKRRLPGFSGEWNEVELSEIGKTYGGLSGKVKSDFGNGSSKYIPFMNIMNNPIINTSFLERVNIKPSENQEKAQKGDLFFNGSSETPEEVGMCSVLTEDITDLYLNSFCFGFRLKEKHCTNGLWLAYYFRSDVGRELIFSLAQGATRYNLSKTNFVKLKIKCPTPNEQVAIAGVIEAADSEISKLECKLSKLKQIKQGAMQQLLTGKIRLINK